MYAVLVTEARAGDILSILSGEQVLESLSGTFDATDIKNIFKKFVRIPIATLIIDADVGQREAIVDGVKLLRIQRNVRIILLAPGRVPGDPLVSALVAKGVYDIVERDDWKAQLQLTLSREPAEYAYAARWDIQEQSSSTTSRKKFGIKLPKLEFLKKKRKQTGVADSGDYEKVIEPPESRLKASPQPLEPPVSKQFDEADKKTAETSKKETVNTHEIEININDDIFNELDTDKAVTENVENKKEPVQEIELSLTVEEDVSDLNSQEESVSQNKPNDEVKTIEIKVEDEPEEFSESGGPATVKDFSQKEDIERAEVLKGKKDDLTGCFLRDVLNDYSLKPNSSIIFLDLDNLKPVNDTYGHAAGDALLRAFGQHLIVSVRPGDLVVRYGGDEFVIILENVGLQGAELISRRISQCWQGTDYEGRSLRTGVSIGIAQEGVHGNSLEELINTADKAMYRGKKSGKNKLVIAGGARVRAIGASDEKIFGTVTVCVAGAEKGVGTTHTALSIASFLARNKLSVAVAELPDPSPSCFLPSEYDLLGRTLQDRITVLERNCFRYKNIDFYFVDSGSKKSKYLDVFNKNYKYIVLDLGFIKPREEGLHKFITEMMRSTLSILVASATPWKGSVLAHILGSAKDVPDLAGFRNWRIVFTAPDEGYYNQYRKALETERIHSLPMPFSPDPFGRDEERDRILYQLLSSVLDKPEKTGKKGWLPFAKSGSL